MPSLSSLPQDDDDDDADDEPEVKEIVDGTDGDDGVAWGAMTFDPPGGRIDKFVWAEVSFWKNVLLDVHVSGLVCSGKMLRTWKRSERGGWKGTRKLFRFTCSTTLMDRVLIGEGSRRSYEKMQSASEE